MYKEFELLPDIVDKEFKDELSSRLLASKGLTSIPTCLTDRQQEVMDLYFFKSLSMNEVAKRLDITKSAVQYHVDVIRDKSRSRK